MPSSTEHKGQAVTNQTARDVLHGSQSSVSDWEITTNFYAAIHLIRSYLSRKDAAYRRRNFTYEEIPSALTKTGASELIDLFRTMKSACHDARYDCIGEAICAGKLPTVQTALFRIQQKINALHAQMDADGVPPDGL